MQSEQHDRIEERLAALEIQASRAARQNRLLKVCLLLVPAAFLLGAAAQRRELDAGTVTAERLVVLRGADGKVRGRLEVDQAGNTAFPLFGPEERLGVPGDGPRQAPADDIPVRTLARGEGVGRRHRRREGHLTCGAGAGPEVLVLHGEAQAGCAPKLEVFDEEWNALVGEIGGR